jgi:hypothetical protein
MDYECKQNEALRYNRFIVDANGQPYKLTQFPSSLIPRPNFIADIVTSDTASAVSTSKLHFLNFSELCTKYGAKDRASNCMHDSEYFYLLAQVSICQNKGAFLQ